MSLNANQCESFQCLQEPLKCWTDLDLWDAGLQNSNFLMNFHAKFDSWPFTVNIHIRMDYFPTSPGLMYMTALTFYLQDHK